MLFMDGLADLVSKKIIDKADHDWEDFVEADEVLPDENALLYVCFIELAEYMLLDRLAGHPTVIHALKEARLAIQESAADAQEYKRAMSGTVGDQLRYHGMSLKDFV